MLSSDKWVFPGSFNAVHNGHIAIAGKHIKENGFAEFTMLASSNASKPVAPFHPHERVEFLKDAIQDLPEEVAKKIRIAYSSGLVAHYCQENGIKYICKSYRNDQDYKDELAQAKYNKAINPDIETLLIQSDEDEEFGHVSSTYEKVFTKTFGNITSPNTTLRVKQALEMRLNHQYIVGMMGEIGTGKSYTGEDFVRRGAPLWIPTYNIDLDGLGHKIFSSQNAYAHVRKEMVDTFGDSILDTDGSIIRRALGDIVFAPGNEEKLQRLNTIIGPSLMTELQKALAGKSGLIIINAALLADRDKGNMVNNNVVHVVADRKTQLARILARENSDYKRAEKWDAFKEFTVENAEDRIRSQLSASEKDAYFTQQQATKRRGKTITYSNTDETTENDAQEAFLDTVDAVDTDLSLRFSALCTRLGLLWDTQKLFQDIYFHYLQNSLPYHNWNHIKDGVRRIHSLRDKMQEPDLVEMAYFFHDIIYNPLAKSGDNEMQSALLAEKMLKHMWLEPQKVATIKHLILATRHAGKEWWRYTHDERYMMDVDMSILASSPETYEKYAGNIRIEYSHYPDTDYKPGRTAVLQHFLRTPIFYTPEFISLRPQAEENINREIIRLAA